MPAIVSPKPTPPVLAFVSAVALWSAPARATDPPRAPRDITIVPSTCKELPWSGAPWEDLLVIELSGEGTKSHVATVESSVPSATAATSPRISLEPDRCASTAASITITLDVGGRRAQRTLSVQQLEPSARSRAVAIAAAELVHGTSLDVPPVTASKPRPSPRPPPVAATEDEGIRPSVSLFGAAEGRFFPTAGAALVGARLGTRIPLFAWAALGVDGGALFGSADDALGSVDVTLVSAGISALGVVRLGGVNIAIGPRFELGPAWFRGEALAPTTVASTAAAPIALVSLGATTSFRLAGAFAGVVALDGGAAAYGYGARADDRSVTGLHGPMLSVRLGLSWDRELE